MATIIGSVIVSVETLKNAEKAGYAKAYLAQLVPGLRGSIDRRFAPRPASKKNWRAFVLEGKPGDVFEARRWRWTETGYAGGTCWFGIQGDGSVFAMTRDEAFAAVHAVRIASDVPAGALAIERPARMNDLPGVFSRNLD